MNNNKKKKGFKVFFGFLWSQLILIYLFTLPLMGQPLQRIRNVPVL